MEEQRYVLCSIPPSAELQGRPERSWDSPLPLPQHESLELVSQTPSIPKAEQVPARSQCVETVPMCALSHMNTSPCTEPMETHMCTGPGAQLTSATLCAWVFIENRTATVGYPPWVIVHVNKPFWLIFLPAPQNWSLS